METLRPSHKIQEMTVREETEDDLRETQRQLDMYEQQLKQTPAQRLPVQASPRKSLNKSVNFSPRPASSHNNLTSRSMDFYETYHAYVNDMKYLGDQLKVGKFDKKIEPETEKRFQQMYKDRRKMLSPSPRRFGQNPDPRSLSTMDLQLLNLARKEKEAKSKAPVIFGRYKDTFYSSQASSKSAQPRLPGYLTPKEPLVNFKRLKEMHESLTIRSSGTSTRKK